MYKSYFKRAIEGELGEGIQKMYQRDMESKVKEADEEAIVEPDGAIKWKSNGRYLMDDFCEVLDYAGYNFSSKATEEKREAQVQDELKSYRNAKHHYSEEDIYEMRSAFGAGATVVDVITGETITL